MESAVVRCTRRAPPSHYAIKIESFSTLLTMADDHQNYNYVSKDFQAGGHKWRLCLYPKGNRGRSVRDYISLYLELSHENPISPNWQFNVYFKMFVHDKKKQTYLTVQDSDARKMWCFDKLHSRWGFDKLISRAEFHSSDNGYLVNDSCEFGVEVFVPKSSGKFETVTAITPNTMFPMPWDIKNFSSQVHMMHTSPDYNYASSKWNMSIDPHGHGNDRGKYMRFYVNFLGSRPPCRSKLYVKYRLRIKNKDSRLDKVVEGNIWFSASDNSIRLKTALADIRRSSKGYLVNDVLSLDANLTILISRD